MLLSVVILVCNVEKSLGLRVMTISCDKHVVMSDEASRDHTPPVIESLKNQPRTEAAAS